MAESELIDEKGNPPSDNWRELRTRKGWARKQAEDDARAEEKRLEGTEGRSVGEHIKAGARAVFEGEPYRRREIEGGARDRVNPLYDRRRVKPKDVEEDPPKKRRPLYDKE